MSNIVEQYRTSKSGLQDAIRRLRTNIQFSSVDKPVQSIVVTSVMPHEGKSSVSAYLAIAMAETGKKTLIIDCDCRRPMIASYFKQRPPYGLTEVIAGEVLPEHAVSQTAQENLFFIDTKTLANPVEVLGSKRFADVFAGLKQSFDMIILDTPPLCSFIEAALLAREADGTVLVIRPGATEIAAAKEAVAQLEKAEARLLGVALNGVKESGTHYYYSRYYSDGLRKHRKKRLTLFERIGFKKKKRK